MTDPVEQEIRALRTIFWSDRDPDGRAFAPLADAYRRAGQFRQAVELLTDGRDRHPDFATGHAVAARLFMEKGLVEEGELAARRVLELDDENVLALRLLAEALEGKGVASEAATVRARLHALEPPEPAEAEAEPAAEEAEEPEEPEAAAIAEGIEETGQAEEEAVMDLGALAPDEPEGVAEEEPVMDLGALAPDEPEGVAEEEPVMDLGALAPDEPEGVAEEEPVMDLGALAPDEPEVVAEEEPVMDLGALAPDEPEVIAEEEPVMDLGALAPDEPQDVAEPDLDDGPLVTRTMADLYARQGFTARALEVYRELRQVSPHDAELQRRIAELESALRAETEAVWPRSPLDEPDAAGEESVTDLGALAPDEPEPAAEPSEPEPRLGTPGDLAAGGLKPAEPEDTAGPDHVWHSQGQAAGHDVDTPFAWTAEEPEDAEAAGPAISSYFQRLLSWGAEADEESEASPGGGDEGDDGDTSGGVGPA